MSSTSACTAGAKTKSAACAAASTNRSGCFASGRWTGGEYPYLWLDAKIERVREPGGVRQKCVVIANGVSRLGHQEIVGFDVGEAETEAFWREFLRGLRARGLDGVRPVISDAHRGLKHAIAQALGAP